MYCSDCGKKREPDARFCIWCGNEFIYTEKTLRLNAELVDESFVEEYRPLDELKEGIDYYPYASGYRPSVNPSGVIFSAPNIVITMPEGYFTSNSELRRRLLLDKLSKTDRNTQEYWNLLEEYAEL